MKNEQQINIKGKKQCKNWWNIATLTIKLAKAVYILLKLLLEC